VARPHALDRLPAGVGVVPRGLERGGQVGQGRVARRQVRVQVRDHRARAAVQPLGRARLGVLQVGAAPAQQQRGEDSEEDGRGAQAGDQRGFRDSVTAASLT